MDFAGTRLSGPILVCSAPMARPLTDVELHMVNNHLVQFGITHCPLCRNQGFQAVGLEFSTSLKGPNPSLHDEFIYPVVAVHCVSCFYVLRFAWLPMQQKLGGAGV